MSASLASRMHLTRWWSPSCLSQFRVLVVLRKWYEWYEWYVKDICIPYIAYSIECIVEMSFFQETRRTSRRVHCQSRKSCEQMWLHFDGHESWRNLQSSWCSTLFKSNMRQYGTLDEICSEEGFNPSRKVQSVLQALSPLRFQCSFLLFGSDWEIERQLQCRDEWYECQLFGFCVLSIQSLLHFISGILELEEMREHACYSPSEVERGRKGEDEWKMVKDGRLEILGQSWKASRQFDVEMMWKYFRFFNSSRFLAFEPFEFWIISVSEVLFDSDSLPLPCAMLFNAGDCYARCLQQIWQGHHDSTAPVLKCGNDQTVIQSSQWKRRVSAETETAKETAPELHDAWRDVCLTRTEVVLWKDESSPRSLRSTFQRPSIWIYVSIFDRQLYWEGITEVFDLPSFQATKSRVSWN